MITLPVTLVTLWINGITTFWAFHDYENCGDVKQYLQTNTNVQIARCMSKEQASDFWKQMTKPKLDS